MCNQHRLRPACAYAQSDQSFCSLLAYSMSVKLLTEHHLEFLSLKGGCTGSYESTLVKMAHCWKSHVTAQISHVFISLLESSEDFKTSLRVDLLVQSHFKRHACCKNLQKSGKIRFSRASNMAATICRYFPKMIEYMGLDPRNLSSGICE